MKTSMIAQMAVLAFAFNVTAGPINARCENELAVAATSPAQDSESPAESAAPTSKTKKAKTSKTKGPKTTAAPTGGSGGGDDGDSPASTAAPTGTQEAETPTPTGETGGDVGGETGGENGGDVDEGSGGNGTVTTPGGSTGTAPSAGGSSTLSAPMIIAAGQSFDGQGATFGRGVSCTGQAEGGDSDAVFILEAGASLSNVVIGEDQIEGVHCNGGCKLTNVSWLKVCEDAFTIKKQTAGQTSTITGGSAKGASDKVFQHNGAGTLSVSDFTVSDFGKLYRSCGNCKESAERHIIMDGITASTGDILVGINPNFGDTAKITNSKLSGVKSVCTKFTGVKSGSEPSKVGEGADGTSCIFGADVVQG